VRWQLQISYLLTIEWREISHSAVSREMHAARLKCRWRFVGRPSLPANSAAFTRVT